MFSVAHFFLLFCVNVFIAGNVLMHDQYYCYSKDPIKPQNGMFTTHTAYDTLRGQNINANASSCSPSKFWMLGRHGTRLPNPTETGNMLAHNERIHGNILSHYNHGKTSVCASDIELLKSWRLDPNVTLETVYLLTPAGWNEIKGISQRYQTAFPTILSSAYSPKDFFFRSTSTSHTRESLHAFADGLFGTNGHLQVQFEEIPERDYFLTPQLHCPLYSDFVATLSEHLKFSEGPEYQEMTSQVSAKLGFHGSHALRNIEVDTLCRICKYEHIWNVGSISSPMCAGFSIANHQVLEYYDDVEFYYRNGYGHSNNRRVIENMGCFLVQDLLDFLRSNDSNEPKAKVFNEGITMLMALVLNLGAFEDDVPLTRHNFAQQTQRLWRTSLISPMASNLVVVRYDCADDDDNDILFLFNEKPLQIPGCERNGLCKQSVILERLSRLSDVDCMEVYCSNNMSNN